MKTVNKIVGLLLMIALIPKLNAQDKIDLCTINEKQMTCYTLNSATLWKELISEIESMPEFETNYDLQFEWVRCHYGLAGVYISENDSDNGEPILDLGIKMNAKLLELDNANSNYNAMMSALYGMEMGFSPMKGMTLGAKSDRHVRKAIKNDATNGFAWLQSGSSYYHTPSVFGGDVEMAVESFKQAADLLKDDYDLSSNWMWLEAMAWLGQAYSKNGEKEKAMETYMEALKVFPEFSWIKFVLLPALKK